MVHLKGEMLGYIVYVLVEEYLSIFQDDDIIDEIFHIPDLMGRDEDDSVIGQC